jgi:TPR repeat protein
MLDNPCRSHDCPPLALCPSSVNASVSTLWLFSRACVLRAAAAKLGTAQRIDTAKENDPVELWKAVRRGSVSEEVALANLYLEGEAVPQNCEQAHTLLYAASMKGSKAADTLLKSSYAERCK